MVEAVAGSWRSVPYIYIVTAHTCQRTLTARYFNLDRESL
jgi:hypothetical protein